MLQIQTIKSDCLALLKELMRIDELKHFRLAGGTALSLHLGHRTSIDLDFFTNQLFDVNEFIDFLKIYFNDRLIINGSNRYGIFTEIDHIKVDFLYRYEKFSDSAENFDGIRLSSVKDIAGMKIQAASSRGSKKDYYDLFELLNVFTFAELIELFKKTYTNYELASVLKSMSSFAESDLEDNPVSLRSNDWELIKSRIGKEIKDYVNNLQQMKIDTENSRQKSIEEIIKSKKGGVN